MPADGRWDLTRRLKVIFGRIQDRDGTWKIKTNHEFSNIIRNKNIVNYIVSLIIELVWPCTASDKRKNVQNLSEWKPTSLAGRPNIRW